MRFVAFKKNREARLGVRTDAGVIDLAAVDESLPTDLKQLLAMGKGGMQRAGRAARKAPEEAVVKGRINYLPPIQEPQKMICVGLNYKDHAAEAGMKIPTYPVLFVRFPTSMVGHGQPLIAPKASRKFDYEAELVAVIGSKARNVKKSEALNHVALILFEGLAATLAGEYIVQSNRMAKGLKFVRNVYIASGVSSVLETQAAQKVYLAQPEAALIAIDRGAALVLGPNQHIETWGRPQIVFRLGSESEMLDRSI